MIKTEGAASYSSPTTTAIILAAGSGSRFVGNKLIAPFRGRPLVSRAIDAASASHALNCALVLGHDADAVLDCVDVRRCAVVRSENWSDGIAASIRAGLAHARDADACIFLLGDQPFVTSADLDALLLEAARERSRLHGRTESKTQPSIVALRCAGVWGAPVLFPRRDFAALERLRGDHGAKGYAQTQSLRLRFVTARDSQAFTDIDTRADLRALAKRNAR